MPTFEIKAPDGRTVVIDGTRPPSEADIKSIFSKIPDFDSSRKSSSMAETRASFLPQEERRTIMDEDPSDEGFKKSHIASYLTGKWKLPKDLVNSDTPAALRSIGYSGDIQADYEHIRKANIKDVLSGKSPPAPIEDFSLKGFLDKLNQSSPEKVKADVQSFGDRLMIGVTEDLGLIAKDVAKLNIRGLVSRGVSQTLEGIWNLYSEKNKSELGLVKKLFGEDSKVTKLSKALSEIEPSEFLAQSQEEFQAQVEAATEPGLPELKDSLAAEIIAGPGQGAAALISAVLPGGLVMTVTSQAYQAGREDYESTQRAKGLEIDPEKRNEAGLLNVPSAAIDYVADKLLISRILQPLKGKATIQDIPGIITKSAISGGLSEGAEQFWQNIVAKELAGYDPNREIDQGVVDSVIIGAFTDSSLAAIGRGARIIIETPLPSNQAEWRFLDKTRSDEEVRSIAPPQIKESVVAAKHGDTDAQAVVEAFFQEAETEQTAESVMEPSQEEPVKSSMDETDIMEVKSEDGSNVETIETTTGLAHTIEPAIKLSSDSSPLPEGVVALRKQDIRKIREDYDLDKLPKPTRERFEQVLQQAKSEGLNDSAVVIAENIVKSPRALSAKEHAGMVIAQANLEKLFEQSSNRAQLQYELGNISEGTREFQFAQKYLEQIELITRANSLSGTEIGRALSARRIKIERDTYKLVNIIRSATNAKQKPLTQSQIDELSLLSAQLEEQQNKIEKLEEELAKKTEENSKQAAQKYVDEQKNTVSRRSKESASERRSRLKKELSDLGIRVNDITNIIGLSLDAANIITRIAKTYIEEGAHTLDEVVRRLQEDIPDISDRDIYDALGGRIRKEKKRVETEVEKQLKELKKQAKLEGDILDAMEGNFPEKKAKSKQSKRVKQLQDQLNKLKNEAFKNARDDAQLKRINTKINEIQDQLNSDIKKVEEDPIPKDIADAISIAKENLKDLRGQLKAKNLVKDLEAQLNSGSIRRAQKSERSKSEQLKSLHDTIKNLRDQLRDAQLENKQLSMVELKIESIADQINKGYRLIKPQRPIFESVKEARKKMQELRQMMSTDDAIMDLEEQLRTGEYRVNPKKQRVIKSAQLEEALIKKKQLQREIRNRIERLKPITTKDVLMEPFLLSRQLLATADLGATLRQGLILSSRRPITALKIFSKSTKAFFSQNSADAIDVSIRMHPNQIERDKAGLFLSKMDSDLNSREEFFMSKLIDRVPVIKSIWKLSGAETVTKASERNMITTLNLLRSAAFDSFIQNHPESTIEQRIAYADYINKASGRGDLGSLSPAAQTLSNVFFAPRYAVSRFQAPYALVKNIKDPLIRNEIAKDFLALATTGMTTLMLAWLAGLEVGIDPEDSDFGKIIIGDTRIDIWGGLQQPMRLIIQPILTGLDTLGIKDREKDASLWDISSRFLTYKLSPAINLPITLISGENVIGQDQGVSESLIRAYSPLVIQESIDIWNNTHDPARTSLGFLGFLGIGVSEHSKSNKKKPESIKRESSSIKR